MAMNRRTFSKASGLFATVLAGPALLPTSSRAQTPAGLTSAVEDYINSIGTLEADFTQTAPDGSLSTGKFFLDRPGRMRIDYDPPSKILLIARDWRLIYYDGSIKQVTTIPLTQTPLSVLLDEEVSLSGDVEVIDTVDRGEIVDMTLVRGDARDQGSVTLSLDRDPVRLLSWVINDPQGNRTQLELHNVQLGKDLDATLFRWRDPKFFGWPEDD